MPVGAEEEVGVWGEVRKGRALSFADSERKRYRGMNQTQRAEEVNVQGEDWER